MGVNSKAPPIEPESGISNANPKDPTTSEDWFMEFTNPPKDPVIVVS